MRKFINIADIDKKNLRLIIDNAKTRKKHRKHKKNKKKKKKR